MNILVSDINETAVLEFMKWRYEPPYERYNMSRDGQRDFQEAVRYFTNPRYEFHLMHTEVGELVGFFSFGTDAQVPGWHYPDDALDIGMAVKPAYTGKGLGVHFANTAVAYAITHHNYPTLRVTIAEFNQRAQKVWQRLGFQQIDRFLELRFDDPYVIMCKKVGRNE